MAVVNASGKFRARFERLFEFLKSIKLVDTHEHLLPRSHVAQLAQTPRGPGVNLYALWRHSYFPSINHLTEFRPPMSFQLWWESAQADFTPARATSFYRYQLSAFKDLYHRDFAHLSALEAAHLDEQIFLNYQRDDWVDQVVTRHANIEYMFIDPHWCYGEIRRYYDFQVMVFRVQHLIQGGFHISEFQGEAPLAGKAINPYEYAQQNHIPVKSFEDYLAVVEHMVHSAQQAGAVCLKHALAYYRDLDFPRTEKTEAARAFGRPRSDLTALEIRAFQNYLMWYVTELSAQYGLPLQIHTGPGRLPGTNPLQLVNLIEGNPQARFIILHGGYPWIEEIAALVLRFPHNVWVDSCWLPLISDHLAIRAFQEWLDVIPADRIMWGGDCLHAEGIYGAVRLTQTVLARCLAERVEEGTLDEGDAGFIGRQILRDSALGLFPQLQAHKGQAQPSANQE
jgi:uncharacterized protein